LIDTEIAPIVNGSPFESSTTHRFSEGTDVTTQAPLRTNILKKITNVNMQEAEFRLHLHQKLINMDGVSAKNARTEQLKVRSASVKAKKDFYINREIQIKAFLLFRLCRTQQILGEWQATLIRGFV
jgi:hypothetical protein